jgi:hypothetical protein
MADIIKKTIVSGCFGLPLGIKFFDRKGIPAPKSVTVSTVCLNGVHMQDPLHICSPETGYETMVFLEDCTFFSLFTVKYDTRRKAVQGHKSTVRKLLARKLPLAIHLEHYYAWDATDG